MRKMMKLNNSFVSVVEAHVTMPSGTKRAVDIYLLSKVENSVGIAQWFTVHANDIIAQTVQHIVRPMYLTSDRAELGEQLGCGSEALAKYVSEATGTDTKCVLAEPIADGTEDSVSNPLATDMVAYSAKFESNDGFLMGYTLISTKAENAKDIERIRDAVAPTTKEMYAAVKEAANISRNAKRKTVGKLVAHIMAVAGTKETYALEADFFLQASIK